MSAASLSEAAVRLGKSERSIRRMIERGELDGKLLLHDGRYRWAVTLPEPEMLPALAATTPDAVAILLRIEAKLDQLLAAQSALAGSVPIAAESPLGDSPPRVSWWRRLLGVFAFDDGEQQDGPPTTPA